jgi:hypothetical protein
MPTYCLVTRIKANRFSTFLKVIVAFLRMRRRAMSVPGLLETTLLVRPQRTILLISLWEDEKAMADFGTACPDHALGVRMLYHDKAEVWSGLFEFVGASTGSKPWTKELAKSASSAGRSPQ